MVSDCDTDFSLPKILSSLSYDVKGLSKRGGCMEPFEPTPGHVHQPAKKYHFQNSER